MSTSLANEHTQRPASEKAIGTFPRAFRDEILDDAMAAILRSKTPTERLAIAFRLWKFARKLMRETLRHEHPDWDEATLRHHIAQRMPHGAV
jgi:hypothetical protein